MGSNAAKPVPFVIRTGVPRLDALFRSSSRPISTVDDFSLDSSDEASSKVDGFSLDSSDEASSICIAGPDGTGKSVLAMHFGARYAADSHQFCLKTGLPDPRCFYVSSDLSFTKAESMWKGFALNRPNSRLVPFRADKKQTDWESNAADPDYELPLTLHTPEALTDLATYLKAADAQFAFIDLAANTAGDDWAFLQRLLASIPPPHEDAPRHLLVIDAMEGMEAFGGDVDAFGEKTTRRGRVAKLMRLAARKCHLVLVVEEPADRAPLAEQFVADVVIRLRAADSEGYSRRMIEIEKARGQLHVRGRHPYVIRDGRGSTTGRQMNFDDPVLRDNGVFQSYIDIFPSLHSLSSAVIRSKGAGRESRSDLRAGFGIRELDEMLAEEDLTARNQRDVGDGQDDQGLPCGAVTALIGDANTQKSFLGIAFLGHHFHDLAWRAVTWNEEPLQPETPEASKYYRQYLRNVAGADLWSSRIEALGRDSGAVVLITTKDESSRTLADRFLKQVEEETHARVRSRCRERDEVARRWNDQGFREALRAYIESRSICRRLEIHDMPSPVLFHEIRRSIEGARQVVEKRHIAICSEWPKPVPNERAREGWRVRFVLDDYNSVTRTYGKVRADPLFLPFLLLHLRREGLSALIIETQAGMHGMPASEVESDLGALSDHRLYTWHVKDFFGDHRIAIAAIPPLVKRDLKSPVLVRELEWSQPSSGTRPQVNPRFELYAGLDSDKPTLVPLRVHLYAKTAAWEQYIRRLNEIWKRVFDSPRPEDERELRSVVFAEEAENYDVMREACELHANTNLDYSLIIQIDEFWQHGDTFRPQERFLKAVPDTATNLDLPRFKMFDTAYALTVVTDPRTERTAKRMPDRIPFAFDFGFLACRERAWSEATREQKLSNAELEAGRKNAAKVWQKMKKDQPYSWSEFIKATSHVAKWDSAQRSQPVPAFDLAMVAPETFSCLVLEIWFSEIIVGRPDIESKFAELMANRSWEEERDPRWTLPELVRQYRDELYQTWLLLVECLDLDSFATRKEGFGFEFGRRADPKAVASRQWYKTASLSAPEQEEKEMIRFCRLPGSFSVRGDWFLAAVRGSRSDRLVDRALDLLSTPEANLDRLIRGLALPTLAVAEPGRLSSRLHGWHGSSETPETLTYADVLSLGPTGDKSFWLWRGNLTDYHFAAPIWERWLYRVLRRWKRTRESFGSAWISGFEIYDWVKESRGYDALRYVRRLEKETVSYGDFKSMCDKLCGELAEAERSRRGVSGRAGRI